MDKQQQQQIAENPEIPIFETFFNWKASFFVEKKACIGLAQA